MSINILTDALSLKARNRRKGKAKEIVRRKHMRVINISHIFLFKKRVFIYEMNS